MSPSLGLAIFVALRGWLPLIEHEARAAGVDPSTLAVIIWHESRGRSGEVFHERDGACSIGLGGIRVPGCEPARVQQLKSPAYNIRMAAKILRANERWCKKRRDRQCVAGDRVFRGGGAVNHYGGHGTRYAHTVLKLKRALKPHWPARKKKRSQQHSKK